MPVTTTLGSRGATLFWEEALVGAAACPIPASLAWVGLFGSGHGRSSSYLPPTRSISSVSAWLQSSSARLWTLPRDSKI